MLTNAFMTMVSIADKRAGEWNTKDGTLRAGKDGTLRAGKWNTEGREGEHGGGVPPGAIGVQHGRSCAKGEAVYAHGGANATAFHRTQVAQFRM